MSSEMQQAITEARKELKGFEGDVKSINNYLEKTIKNLEKSGDGISSDKAKKLNDELKKNIQFTEQLNADVKERNRLEKTLYNSISKNKAATSEMNKQIALQKFETSTLNRQNKEAAILNSKLSTEYQKLVVKMKQAGQQVQELTIKKSNAKKWSDIEQKELKQSIALHDRYRRKVALADKAIGRSQVNVRGYGSAIKGLGLNFRSILGAFGVTSGILIFSQLMRGAIDDVLEFDRQLIAVGKTTDLSKKDLKAFGEEAIKVGLNLKGISIQNLLESSEIAGQLGIRGSENILKFSETIEKLRLTSDLAGQEAARSFAKFIEVSSDSVENADRLGSVITALGNNFATTEGQILKNTNEIQKGLAIYSTSAQSVIGLGAATNALGSEAEATRGALQKTFKTLNDGATQGKNLEKILALTGQTAAEFKEEFGRDSVKTFQRFVKGLSESDAGGKNLSNTLAELGLSEKRTEAVVGSLAKNYGTLQSALSMANLEYYENTALTKEADAAAESLVSKISDLEDVFTGMTLSIENGNGVLGRFAKDAINNAIESFEKLSLILRDDIDAWDKWKLGVNNATRPMAYFLPWMEKGNGLFQESTDNLLADTAAREENAKAVQKQVDKFIALNGSLAPLREGQDAITDEPFSAIVPVENTSNPTSADPSKIEKVVKARQQQISVLEGTRDAAIKLKESFGDLFVKGVIDAEQYEGSLSQIDLAAKQLTEGIEATEIGGALDGLIADGAPNPIADAIAEIDEGLQNLPWDEALEKAGTFFNDVGQLASTLFDRGIQQTDDEIAKSDEKYNRLLDNDRLLQSDRIALEMQAEQQREALEKKKNEQLRKKAVADKAFSAVQVIINTAVAISKVQAQAGLLGIPLAAIVAAQGALQLATVLAQPIPQFKDGLSTDYEGKGIINDEKIKNYRELVVRRSGKLEMFNERNKTIDIKKGDRILPATMTSSVIQRAMQNSYIDQENKLVMAETNRNTDISNAEMTNRIERVVKEIPQARFSAPSAREIGKATANAIRIDRDANKV